MKQDINTWRRKHNALCAQATNYLYDNKARMALVKQQHNVSYADQLCVQCEIPYEVAQHIVGKEV